MHYESLHINVSPDDIDVGDVVVFGNKEERDVYIISYDVDKGYFLLISLIDFCVVDRWSSVLAMHESLVRKENNGFQLIEVIPSEKLELKRYYEQKNN